MPLLFDHFLKQYNNKLGKNINKISEEAEDLLLHYTYPGNIRELSNIIEYGVLLSEDGFIKKETLPKEVRAQKIPNKYEGDVDSLVGLSLKDIERKIIEATLQLNKYHRKDTALMLGISERGLRNKINEYNLK